MKMTPPNIKLKDVDRVEKKFKAFRCHACRKDLDHSLNPEPKRSCQYCGCGEWEQVRSLTLHEAYFLYSETGVLFLNEDKPQHRYVQKFLDNSPRFVRWLDGLQQKQKMMKWPYRWLLRDVLLQDV